MRDINPERPTAPDTPKLGARDFPVFKTPNGLEIFHHSQSETEYVYREIFEDRVYFRHGINLLTGESVFDIGANIGLFTIFVKESFPSAKVHAFEPSPVIFQILQANVAKYGESVSLHPCGMADRRGQATFTFYPHYSIMSGFHAGSDQDRKTLRAGISSRLKEQNMNPEDIQESSLDRLAKIALGQKQEYTCQLLTVSDIMDESDTQAVGLLKIDAEGSELDILAGIRAGHWARIRQIAMEIHDPAGTACPQVRTLLEGRGYTCIFEQEKRLSGSGIVNCYARRV